MPRRLLLAVVAAILGGVLGLLLPASPPRGLTPGTGDEALAERTRSLVSSPNAYTGLGVIEVRDGDVRSAGLGATAPGPDTPIELGSITKTFTAHLLAFAVQRGEARLEDQLSRHLPELASTPAGSVTLLELAQHSSGLPRIADNNPVTGAAAVVAGADPYRGQTEAVVIDAARSVQLNDRGQYDYSNLGMALLGAALARAAHSPDWAALAEKRLFAPLGMVDTVIATTTQELPPGRAIGHADNGRVVQPWLSAGYAPAGSSTWTTLDDMGRYLEALLGAAVPGADAVAPTATGMPGTRIGLAWTTLEREGLPALTFHNGGTGGFSTNITFDEESSHGVFVVGDSPAEVQNISFRLVAGDQVPQGSFSTSVSPPWTGIAVLVTLLVMAGAAWRRPSTRLGTVTRLLGLALLGLLAVQLGPWQLIPFAVGTAALAVGVAGAVVSRDSQAPWLAAKPWSRVWQLVGCALSVLLLGLLVVALVSA